LNEAKDLYNGNHKSLKKEIKEAIRRYTHKHTHTKRQRQIESMIVIVRLSGLWGDRIGKRDDRE
jgi:hypothetical protein